MHFKLSLTCLSLTLCASTAFADDPPMFQRYHGAFPAETSAGGHPAFGDVDRDGDMDVLLTGVLYLNDGGGTFTLAPKAIGLRTRGKGIFVDYDKDGDLDVFLTASGERGDRLMRNVAGQGEQPRFVEAFAGMFEDGLPAEGVAWGDLNGDGCPDLYLANYETYGVGYRPDRLWLSNGTNGFVAAHDMIPAQAHAGRGVTMADFDQDGDLDIYVSNYRLGDNFLWVNKLEEWGRFALVNEAWDRGISGGYAHTIGSAWGDLNNDGRLDLLMGNFSHPGQPMVAVCLQNTSASFSTVAGSAYGIQWEEAHSHPTLFDYDDDGDLDLYLTSTYGRKSHFYMNRLIQDGQLRFNNAIDNLGAVSFDGWGSATADVDGDGDLDLLVISYKKPMLFRNNRTTKHPKKRSVRLRLRGRANGSDTHGAGAIVTLSGGGAPRQTRVLTLGHGISSQSEQVIHFGVGARQGPFDIEIRWPSGRLSRLSKTPGYHFVWEPTTDNVTWTR